MEIRNNVNMNSSPAFGMAVLKPARAEDYARFVAEVTEDVYLSSKHVEKALKRVTARAAKNSQFDIKPFVQQVRSLDDGRLKEVSYYQLVPKTQVAEEMMKENNWKTVITGIEMTPLEVCQQRCSKRLAGKKGIKRTFAKVANFFDAAKELVTIGIHPEKNINGRLRYAIRHAEDCEAAVLNRLKNEKLVDDILEATKVVDKV